MSAAAARGGGTTAHGDGDVADVASAAARARPAALGASAGALSLHITEWNPAGAIPVLFLHGWLDHGRGFDWVVAELPATYRCLALDFRGHGSSGHLPAGAQYHFTDYLADVEAALAAARLESVHLVGHSLGGGVALVYAAAAPARVRSVLAVESVGPPGGASDKALDRVRRFVAGLAAPARKRSYASIEAAAARMREVNPGLSPAGALQMATHGTRARSDGGGHEFTFDPEHRKAFGMVYDEEQLLAIFAGVRAPVKIVRGSRGFPFPAEATARRLAAIGAAEPTELPGGHHVQLDSPAALAAEIAAHVERSEGGPKRLEGAAV